MQKFIQILRSNKFGIIQFSNLSKEISLLIFFVSFYATACRTRITVIIIATIINVIIIHGNVETSVAILSHISQLLSGFLSQNTIFQLYAINARARVTRRFSIVNAIRTCRRNLFRHI